MNSRKTSLKYTLWEIFSYIPMFSFVANQLKSSLWWWNSLDFLLQTPSPSSCHTCSDTRQSCHCQLCQSTTVNTVAVHIVHHWCSHTNRSCSFCVFAHMQKCWKKEFGEESHLRCFSPVRGRRSCLIVLLFSLREWLRESSSWWHLGKRQKHFILWIWDRFWKLCFDSGCEKTRGNPGKKTPVSCGIAWSFFVAQTTLWRETAPRDKCILWSSGSSDSLGITCLDTQPHSL